MLYTKTIRVFLACTIAFIFILSSTAFAKTKNWGLGFRKEGEKPIGDESAEYLKKYDAYYIGESDEKVLYLTFDAGYENGYTEKILDVLKDNNVPATFFLVGNYFKENPEIIKRMESDGHIIANHTMNHRDMSAITDANKFKEQLSQVESLYQEITGKKMKNYYRPPEGKYSERNLEMTKELGYKTILWSLAYNDYNNDKQPSSEQAFSKLLPRVHPGAVILLHSTSKTNSEILNDLIKKYRDMGYEFKTLDYLTGDDFQTDILTAR